MNLMYETFIKPIAEVTSQQDNLESMAERLASRHKDLTEGQMKAAVDLVLAKWNNKRFPVYKLLDECLTASKASKRQTSITTEADYREHANAFVEARSGCYAAVPYSEQWLAWMDYFEAKGHLKQIKHMHWRANDTIRWRDGKYWFEKNHPVPCEWPWDFDRSFHSRVPTAREPERPVYQSNETRMAVLAKLGFISQEAVQ